MHRLRGVHRVHHQPVKAEQAGAEPPPALASCRAERHCRQHGQGLTSLLSLQGGWRSVFDTFDTDHDGSISEPEIRSALAKAGITDAEMRALMDQYDINRYPSCLLWGHPVTQLPSPSAATHWVHVFSGFHELGRLQACLWVSCCRSCQVQHGAQM